MPALLCAAAKESAEEREQVAVKENFSHNGVRQDSFITACREETGWHGNGIW